MLQTVACVNQRNRIVGKVCEAVDPLNMMYMLSRARIHIYETWVVDMTATQMQPNIMAGWIGGPGNSPTKPFARTVNFLGQCQ